MYINNITTNGEWVKCIINIGSDQYFNSVTSDMTGQKLYAASFNGGIYFSNDYGITWNKTNAPDKNIWISIKSNKIGNTIFAISKSQIYKYIDGYWLQYSENISGIGSFTIDNSINLNLYVCTSTSIYSSTHTLSIDLQPTIIQPTFTTPPDITIQPYITIQPTFTTPPDITIQPTTNKKSNTLLIIISIVILCILIGLYLWFFIFNKNMINLNIFS